MMNSDDELRFWFLQRREAEWRIRQLRQRRKRRESGFPFNLVERAVRWLLIHLEQAVGTLVSAVLKRVRQR